MLYRPLPSTAAALEGDQRSYYLLICGTNGYESDPIRVISCFFTNNPISVERTTLILTPYLAPFPPPQKTVFTRYKIEKASRKGVSSCEY